MHYIVGIFSVVGHLLWKTSWKIASKKNWIRNISHTWLIVRDKLAIVLQQVHVMATGTVKISQLQLFAMFHASLSLLSVEWVFRKCDVHTRSQTITKTGKSSWVLLISWHQKDSFLISEQLRMTKPVTDNDESEVNEVLRVLFLLQNSNIQQTNILTPTIVIRSKSKKKNSLMKSHPFFFLLIYERSLLRS